MNNGTKTVAIMMSVIAGIVFLGIGFVDLITTKPNECEAHEIWTDLNYGGGAACVSPAAYEDLLMRRCVQKVENLNRSMSDTWGNDEYNTEYPTRFAETFIDKCVERLRDVSVRTLTFQPSKKSK